jgi:hypothetical protein
MKNWIFRRVAFLAARLLWPLDRESRPNCVLLHRHDFHGSFERRLKYVDDGHAHAVECITLHEGSVISQYRYDPEFDTWETL